MFLGGAVSHERGCPVSLRLRRLLEVVAGGFARGGTGGERGGGGLLVKPRFNAASDLYPEAGPSCSGCKGACALFAWAQGYLARKNASPPWDQRRALGAGLLQGVYGRRSHTLEWQDIPRDPHSDLGSILDIRQSEPTRPPARTAGLQGFLAHKEAAPS